MQELHNALLIHNPNAGNGGSGRRRLLDEARRIFAGSGIETDLSLIWNYNDSFTLSLKGALLAGSDLLHQLIGERHAWLWVFGADLKF